MNASIKVSKHVGKVCNPSEYLYMTTTPANTKGSQLAVT
jgi:hypothetical protein